MRITTLSLITLSALVVGLNHALARTIDSCVSLEGMTDVSRLEQALDKAAIPYRLEPRVLCVSQDHRDDFYRLVHKVFPPDSLSSRSIKVPPSPSGIPLVSSRLTDRVQHMMLQEELKRQRIWYTTDESGALWYEVSKQEQVRELIFKIIESDIPVGRSVHYAQPFSRDLFKAELTNHGVAYQTKTRHDQEWIVWEEADTPQVMKIQEFVSNKAIEHTKKRLESEKK